MKGAGITPFSREGDGRAVLRSSIREYLCSEAMHGLGIPTSRALCIVGSDAEVYRETIESAAVVTRLSPSHVRFGSFEVFAYRGQHEPIAVLADYVIAKHFPDIGDAPDKYLRFLNEVITRTAKLMAKWQAVGFAHGVMNTDNMSILGLTFDYGPFGFMETYDPGFICNHSDHGGRYAFDQQPQIGLWNLSCLAQALTPIIAVEEAQEALENYEPTYFEHYIELMGKKLGLTNVSKEDVALIPPLLEMMRASQLDYTNLFRSLGLFKSAPDEKTASCAINSSIDRRSTLGPKFIVHACTASRERTKSERHAWTRSTQNIFCAIPWRKVRLPWLSGIATFRKWIACWHCLVDPSMSSQRWKIMPRQHRIGRVMSW